MNKRRYPLLRFKGFTGEWERKKLGYIGNYRRGSFPQPYGKKEWYDELNGMPFVQVIDVGTNLKLVNETKQKISLLAQDKSVFVPKGKIVITLQGSIGRVAITQYDSFVDRTLLIFENYNISINEYFFAYILQDLFKVEERKAPGGTIKTITKEVLSDFDICFPKLLEQTQIGNFFRNLDRLIAESRAAWEKSRQLKKAMLAKMFPANGEKIPKIRFKGFEGEWERKKLGEVVEIIGGGTPDTTNAVYWNGNIDWYSPTEIGKNVYVNGSVKKITQLGLQKSSATILPANKTVLFTSRASIGDMAILAKQGTTNQGFQSFVVGKELDVYFLYTMGFKIKYYALKNASGSTFLEVSKNKLSQMNIFIPIFAEQTKIGNFFRQLDETIALQAVEIEKLNQLKKAFLATMLV